MQDLDHLFLRYAKHGDLRALEEVFDRCAPGILKLTRYLVHDDGQAEDVLQETFVGAIESAKQYRGDEPLSPWLLGIATNRARMLQRRRRIRKMEELTVSVDDGPGPSELAAWHELDREFDMALAGMPLLYREVLDLHLRGELEPIEVARTLGRSPDTVRSQLRRGLDLLRKALPAGVGGVLAMSSVSAAAGVSRVRTAVLAKAGAVAALSHSTWWSAKLVAVAVLLLSPVTWFAWSGYAAHPDEGEGPAGIAARDDGKSEAPGERRPPDAQIDPGRVVLATQGEEGPAVGSVIRGVCVDEFGAPLSAVVVWANAWVQVDGQRQGREFKVKALSDAAGEFALPLRFETSGRVSLVLSKQGFVGMDHGNLDLVPGQDHELGDLALSRGCRVSGIVLDSHGDPVVGCFVGASAVSTLPYHPTGSSSRRSGPGGGFEFTSLVSVGTFRASVRPRQFATPFEFEVVAGQKAARLELRVIALDQIEAIEGRLIDEEGAAVVGADVQALTIETHFRGSCQTDLEGRWRVELKYGARKIATRLFISSEFGNLRPEGAYDWGTRDLCFTLPTSRSLDLSVIDRSTKKPIEDYGVRLIARNDTEWGGADAARVRLMGSHENGLVRIEGLRKGEFLVFVQAANGRRSEAVPVDLRGIREHALEIGISDFQTKPVVVMTPGGQPISGAQVQLIQPLSDQALSFEAHIRDLEGLVGFGTSNTRDFGVKVFEATTDEAGSVLIQAPGPKDYTLRVVSPDAIPVQLDAFRIDGSGESQSITLAGGASLVGRVRPLSLLQKYLVKPDDRRLNLRVSLGRRHRGRFSRVPLFQDQPSVFVEADGSFRLSGIPLGPWDLHIGSDSISVSFDEEREYARDFDLSHLLEGTLVGRVFLDGRSVKNARISFLDPLSGGVSPGGSMRPIDEHGVARVSLRQGTYRALVMIGWPVPECSIPLREIFTVWPGKETEVELHGESATLKIRLLHSDGEPFKNQRLKIHQGVHWLMTSESDQEGLIDMPIAPTGKLVFKLRHKRFEEGLTLQKFYEQHGKAAWELALAEVGSVTLVPGESKEIVIRLDERSGY